MGQQIYEWWTSLEVQLRMALINATATLIAAIVAALVVALQVRAQGKNAIAQSEKNEAIKLKLQIYEKILAICAEASEAQLNYSSFVRMFPISLRNIKFCQSQGWNWQLPSERYAIFSKLRAEAETHSIGVIYTVENWGIIDGRMTVFQTAVNAALFDVREAGNRYFRLAMKLFPAPMPDDPGQLFPWSVPSESDIADLDKLTVALLDAIDTLGCFVHDFRVEMQASLLGGLFSSGIVPVRVPIDPTKLVITLHNHKKLQRHFDEHTAWGENSRRIRDEVRTALSSPRS